MAGCDRILKVGVLWEEYQKEVENFMESQLIDLGLLNRHDVEKQNPDSPLLKKYFIGKLRICINSKFYFLIWNINRT